MTRRHLRLLGVLALAAGAAHVAGCGDDPTTCDGPPSVEIRDGWWEVTDEIRVSGTDTTCFPESVMDPDTVIVEVVADTLVECTLSPWGDPDSSNLCCDNVLDGNDVSVSCRVSYPLDVCQLVFEVTAEGTVTDTTWDLQLRFLDTITGDENPCVFFDGYRDTCLTEIHSTGRWLYTDADVDTACGTVSITGQDVVRQVLDRARARRAR